MTHQLHQLHQQLEALGLTGPLPTDQALGLAPLPELLEKVEQLLEGLPDPPADPRQHDQQQHPPAP